MDNPWTELKQTYTQWDAHDAPRLGASLAFYTILSLAPLVIIATGVAALVFGHSAARAQIMGQVQSMIGKDGAQAIGAMLENGQKPAKGIAGTVIGLLTLLFGASGVLVELRAALNRIWDVTPNSSAGIMGLLRERFFSFGMVLSIGFLLLVSLVFSAGLEALGKFWGTVLPVPAAVLVIANLLISFLAISVLFAIIFKFVPETKIAWRDVWVGAFATAFFFDIGKFLIGLYLGKAAVGSTYGAAGSVIVIIIWVYYSSQIFFFGAEFTHVRAKRTSQAA